MLLSTRPGFGLPTMPWWAGRAGMLAVFVGIGYWLSLGSLLRGIGGQTPLAFVGLAPILALGLLIAGLLRRSPMPLPGRIDLVAGLALIVVAAAIVLVAPSFASIYFWTARLDIASLPLFTTGALVILFGWRVLFVARGALVLLLLAWPLPHLVLLENTSELLTDVTAGALAVVTSIVPVATMTSGASAIFKIHHAADPFNVQVATACAGLNSTVAFMLVGGAFAMVLDGRPTRKVAWFLAGIGVVFLFNIVRVVMLVIVGWAFGESAAMDLFHPVAGMATLTLGLILMLMVLPRFGLQPPVFVAAPPSATPLPERPAPTSPRRVVLSRAALLAAIALMFGTVNGSFAAYDLGIDYGAGSAEGAVAVPLPIVGAPTATADAIGIPTTIGGWEVGTAKEITIGRPYFGDDSTWTRFRIWPGDDVPADQRYTAWLDSIVVGDRQNLADFGVEKCYRFHGHVIDGAEQVALGGGLVGRVISMTRASGSAWVVLWWEWPVEVDGAVRHERVVLLSSTKVRPPTEALNTAEQPLLLLGDGAPIHDDARPLVNDLTALASRIVREQTGAPR